jgi:hypothetical protein
MGGAEGARNSRSIPILKRTATMNGRAQSGVSLGGFASAEPSPVCRGFPGRVRPNPALQDRAVLQAPLAIGCECDGRDALLVMHTDGDRIALEALEAGCEPALPPDHREGVHTSAPGLGSAAAVGSSSTDGARSLCATRQAVAARAAWKLAAPPLPARAARSLPWMGGVVSVSISGDWVEEAV